jgi:hypothetical protein
MATLLSLSPLWFAFITVAADYSITCDQTLTGSRSYSILSEVTFEFENPQQQSVIFTNCDSAYDTTMHLYSGTSTSSGAIQDQSTNACDGDDECTMTGTYSCSNEHRQAFQMASLSAGTYTVALGADGYYSSVRTWSLSVYCSDLTTSIADGSQGIGDYCERHSHCRDYRSFCSSDDHTCKHCSHCDSCSDGVDGTCNNDRCYLALSFDCPPEEDTYIRDELIWVFSLVGGLGCLTSILICKGVEIIRCLCWSWRRKPNRQQQHSAVHSADAPSAASIAREGVAVTVQPAPAAVQPVDPQHVSAAEYVPQSLPSKEDTDPQFTSPNSIDIDGGGSGMNTMNGVRVTPQQAQSTMSGQLWATPTVGLGVGTVNDQLPGYGDVAPPPYAAADAPPAYDQVAYQ